jgi:phospholipid/cholesterol/gamma-HCH transport system permease protein
MTAESREAQFAFGRRPGGEVVIELAGVWRLRRGMPHDVAAFEQELISAAPPGRVVFDTSRLESWDSALLTLLAAIEDLCGEHHVAVDRTGLPVGARQLLELANGSTAPAAAAQAPVSAGLGMRARGALFGAIQGLEAPLEFLGQVTLAFGRMMAGGARYRPADFLTIVRATGAGALGIVALISFLVGTILAFMGAVQLQQFGASIYVANLVAIATTREMGAMMTAVIMAGRTGAAFAAQLGTMKVRQEIEALQTMGISPIEFLVLPRVIALVLMMPLLCLYADFIGILGGATIGVGMLHLSLTAFFTQSAKAIYPATAVGGLFKSVVYGILIGLTGCYQGIRCGGSAAAVGEATTAAVVDGIILVVVTCGLFALVFNVIGI